MLNLRHGLARGPPRPVLVNDPLDSLGGGSPLDAEGQLDIALADGRALLPRCGVGEENAQEVGEAHVCVVVGAGLAELDRPVVPLVSVSVGSGWVTASAESHTTPPET